MDRNLLYVAIGSIASVLSAAFAANAADKHADRRPSERIKRDAAEARDQFGDRLREAQTASTQAASRSRSSARTTALKAKGPLVIALVSGVLLGLAVIHAVGIVTLIGGLVIGALSAIGLKVSTESSL